MSRVVVFGLGGAIAMTSSPSGGVVPALSAEDLVAAFPGWLRRASRSRSRSRTFGACPGASLSFEDVYALAEAVRQRFTDGADGVVITQGTDTIEETAFLLGLLHACSEPVVVTGAMRNPTLAGADDPANLLAAVQTAAGATARDLGALVVFADEIHAAARVRKTTPPAARATPGPLRGEEDHRAR
ncbi:L-asparaginase [Actinokineospora iranica]|uniref:L-asparaginase n=1 Tax=Actinokineospora iranica TaxID=1271860 RepID=A0A1G6WSW9_9PSEU|nr:L-asparaginase [Actinokineospora iranica]